MAEEEGHSEAKRSGGPKLRNEMEQFNIASEQRKRSPLSLARMQETEGHSLAKEKEQFDNLILSGARAPRLVVKMRDVAKRGDPI